MRNSASARLLSWILISALTLPAFSGAAQADPTQPNPERARREGVSDGQPDGGREGRERGRHEGEREGRVEGYRNGFARCEREERERHYQQGYRDGFSYGEQEGFNYGLGQGEAEGSERGRREGTADGRARADRDARAEAEPLGAAQGIAQANASDAGAQGQSQGAAAGEEEARQTALRVDYPRGRKDYRDERFAEAVAHEDAFSQRPTTERDTETETITETATETETDSARAVPDFRYNNPRRTYPHASENQAYHQGYRDGYIQGFNGSYRSTYNQHYQMAYRPAEDQGCWEARRQNYRPEYDRGFAQGRSEGYRRGFDRGYQQAFQNAYAREFGPASENTYRAEYPGFYQRHFEAARARAYSERYRELFDAAFQVAKRERFEARYPVLAREQYARGRADEAEDFRLKPARLLGAEISETWVNGVLEPEETLRVKLNLRNFAASGLDARDVRVSVRALDAGVTAIPVADEALVRGLRAKSVTAVSDALDVRLLGAAVGRPVRLAVRVTYQGRDGGEVTLTLNARWALQLQLDADPQFSEGIPTPVRLRTTNVSSEPIPAGVALNFRSRPEILEVTQGSAGLPALAPGESRVVEFTAIARKAGAAVAIPMLFEGLAAGRRWGYLDLTRELPVVNDYSIRLATDVAKLKTQGVTRVEYVIRNESARLGFQGLQLHTRVLGSSGSEIQVIGPNPQLLAPLVPGQAVSFLVPVLALRDGLSGTLELEVQENGRTVVVHRKEF
ncbi:MAG: hypothetical protein IT285_08730 [Bdellovibrionales bacterium]|nr:hypothetical protein [Bdellovibrionales bacterium]